MDAESDRAKNDARKRLTGADGGRVGSESLAQACKG